MILDLVGISRVGISVQLAIVFIITLVEENAAPAGDHNPPVILGFIQFITIHCIIAFIETIGILYFYADGVILIPDCILNMTKPGV